MASISLYPSWIIMDPVINPAEITANTAPSATQTAPQKLKFGYRTSFVCLRTAVSFVIAGIGTVPDIEVSAQGNKSTEPVNRNVSMLYRYLQVYALHTKT